MSVQRKPPIIVSASSPPQDVVKSATFIFIHGLGDDADGVVNIAHQFQAGGKLPHMSWILPNALENRDAMSTAWYMPTPLSPYPSSRPELEDEEDEDGMKSSMTYIVSLIDDVISKGVPQERIILGGFSQGCAISLLTCLTSKYAGKLGGVVGLSGYLPLADRIPALREKTGMTEHVDHEVEVFLVRGTRDMLVPKRHFRICYETLFGLGMKQDKVTIKEYEGLGHTVSGAELRDLCEWLERVVPALE
ncbi:alpha/beta-hydrolase [Pleomassaria siparia CBS 279.74]|uniref:Acyl-protein thioesterase 1 n=1 Tax=Pleomassaria siparia CBS 279.74 TaxID=1314801 RepID=A0A6G1KNR9_9PLEO|nr:alpha/beta-hydrolase [Pleomassaria siparia CBS 279.74]